MSRAGEGAEAVPDRADVVFLNGRVLVMDAADTVETALAVRDGAVCALGAEAEALVPSATRVVDMAGGTLLPGINDSHCHAVAWGMTRPPLMLDLGYPAVTSIADIVDRVRVAVAAAEPGAWITGTGWDLGFLDECMREPGRLPTKEELDAVAPDNPVFLADLSYHAAWLNSAALERADVDAARWPHLVPVNAGGEPIGILYEGVMHAVSELLPAIDAADRRLAAENALAELTALGITSITEPGLGPGDAAGGMAQATYEVYEALQREGRLTMRVSVLRYPVPMDTGLAEFSAALERMAPPSIADPRVLNVLGVKIFGDGIPSARTSWMHEPYVGGGVGALTVPGATDEERVAELRAMIAHAHGLGHQVGVHITGDRGIDTVVEAFAAAVDGDGREDSRHYVIHGDFITPHSLELCCRYGFGVNMNPTIKWTIADLEKEFVGIERAAYAWPYRSALDAGVMVASGSDAPVTAPDWRQGVATMMTRRSKASGEVSGPDQVITLHEALRTYTTAGAWQDFAESWKGTLEVGMVADLCLVAEDLLAIDPAAIPGVQVRMTVFNGNVVHEI